MDTTATLMTDDFASYRAVGKEFAEHETAAHSKGEYSRDGAHTNTAEGFFSQLKRSIDGTHHHVSKVHLPRYLAEFDFRFSTRKLSDTARMRLTVQRTAGRRLMYSDSR